MCFPLLTLNCCDISERNNILCVEHVLATSTTCLGCIARTKDACNPKNAESQTLKIWTESRTKHGRLMDKAEVEKGEMRPKKV